ncbi:hypothetical protein AAFF_G00389350 [Aldrovandia affinis]|uniref:Uncharacterized protein n=1 Tax=Aldrovandia affinis TaxID=143900 RepID=A0AAD7WLB2_9TELE|nr:hypothetical protein AAFF_G00389350 [Aldrovandia affinis]
MQKREPPERGSRPAPLHAICLAAGGVMYSLAGSFRDNTCLPVISSSCTTGSAALQQHARGMLRCSNLQMGVASSSTRCYESTTYSPRANPLCLH